MTENLLSFFIPEGKSSSQIVNSRKADFFFLEIIKRLSSKLKISSLHECDVTKIIHCIFNCIGIKDQNKYYTTHFIYFLRQISPFVHGFICFLLLLFFYLCKILQAMTHYLTFKVYCHQQQILTVILFGYL